MQLRPQKCDRQAGNYRHLDRNKQYKAWASAATTPAFSFPGVLAPCNAELDICEMVRNTQFTNPTFIYSEHVHGAPGNRSHNGIPPSERGQTSPKYLRCLLWIRDTLTHLHAISQSINQSKTTGRCMACLKMLTNQSVSQLCVQSHSLQPFKAKQTKSNQNPSNQLN